MNDLIDRNQLDEVCSRLNEDGWGITRNEYKLIDRVLFEFPSAEKTGKWVAFNGKHFCSNCGNSFDVDTCMGTPMWNYCPNCGSRMGE